MKTARLIVADSEHDANLLYAVGIFVPDPFIFLEVGGRKTVVMSDLEIDRARKHATVDRVLSLSRYHDKLKRSGIKRPCLAHVLNQVLRELRVRSVEVPGSFPVGLARQLRGIRVNPRPDPFYLEREVKTAAEIAHLTKALRLAECGMAAAMDVLRASRIGRDGFLRWHGRKLRSEDVQGIINAAIARLGGTAAHTIVAGGNHGCDPHEEGRGPLRAHQPVIIDIFPRDAKTGYWGDITRTVVRGRASDRVKKMYDAVFSAQELAFQKLRAGLNGQEVHNAILALFQRAGFPTGRRQGRMQGFFHGTGHGLGLEIHEPPRVSAMDATLRAGNVVTVEPGLYYWGTGGVRLEDVAVIHAHGARNLTRFPKALEI